MGAPIIRQIFDLAVADAKSQSAIGLTLRVPKADTARVTSHVLAALPVADLTVEDPPIDEVIERVFSSGREAGQVDQQARAPA